MPRTPSSGSRAKKELTEEQKRKTLERLEQARVTRQENSERRRANAIQVGKWVIERVDEFNLSYHHEGRDDHHFYGRLSSLLLALHDEEIGATAKHKLESIEESILTSKKEILDAINMATPETLEELGIIKKLGVTPPAKKRGRPRKVEVT